MFGVSILSLSSNLGEDPTFSDPTLLPEANLSHWQSSNPCVPRASDGFPLQNFDLLVGEYTFTYVHFGIYIYIYTHVHM